MLIGYGWCECLHDVVDDLVALLNGVSLACRSFEFADDEEPEKDVLDEVVGPEDAAHLR